MRRTACQAIALIGGMAAPGWAQDAPKKEGGPPAKAEGSVGRPGVGIGDLGIGVGVDPKYYTKSELLAVPGVLDELQATTAQRERLKPALEESRREARRLAGKIRSEMAQLKDQGGEDAARGISRQAIEYAKRLTRDHEKPVLKILDAKQVKRLEQIQIRADGYMAFDLPDVTGKLGLTPDQEVALAECISAGRAGVHRAAAPYRQAAVGADGQATPASPDLIATAERTQLGVLAARAETLRAIRKVLTNAQQATYRNLLGPPFDFAKLDPVRALKKAASPAPDEFEDRKP